MPLSVSIQSVTLAGAQGVRVAGTGGPNGATISVSIQIDGDGNGHGATLVNNGRWSVIVNMQNVQSGQTGTATAGATSPQFPGQTAQDSMDFTL